MIKLVQISANNFKQLRDVELRFPASGSILVEGRNEAGKSTLFEAIFFGLFGRPLLPGTSSQDLIAYDANEGLVELTISVPDGQFVVMRRIRRTRAGASADARLRIIKADGEQGEDIRGANSVNQRIQQELLLDADAFLNSCFVEQKKLEKLEGMTRKDRETSLMRLLNLDRLLDHEKAMTVTLEDSRGLERLKQRVELADVMTQLPMVRRRGVEITTALNILAMKEDLTALDEHAAAILEAEARMEALRDPIADLEARMARIEAVKAAAGEVNVAIAQIGKCEQSAQQALGLIEQVEDLDRLECEGLPALILRRRRMAVLRSRWARLLRLEDDAEDVRVDAEGNRRRLKNWDDARDAVAAADERLAALEAPTAELEARLSRIAALRTAAGEADLAGARLGQIEGHERGIADDEAELANLEQLERDGLPALHRRRRRATVLRGQWTRIRALHHEVDRLRGEAAGVRERLARLDAARAELAEMEVRIREQTARADECEVQEKRLARLGHTVSLRNALEDWQAADHARRGLAALEGQIADAEEALRRAEAEAVTVAENVAALRGAARSKLTVGAGLAGLTVVFLVAALVAGIPLLWAPVVVFLLSGAVTLGQWRSAEARADAVAARHEALRERAREAQSALVRLEGQHENAQATQSAASGRLETAVARLESLDESIPINADEAERRLAELPDADTVEGPEAIRDRLAAVRAERAGLRATLEEQTRALAHRRRDAEAENESLLRASAERLDSRAVRITETILDRWTEIATARAASLDIPVTSDPDENREATGRAIARFEAEINVAAQRLDGRAAIEARIAARRDAIVAERERVQASCPALLSVYPDATVPETLGAATARKTDLETEIAALDEPGARRDLNLRRQERAGVERDRAAAERDARLSSSELAARFGCSPDAPPEDLREDFAGEIAALDARANRILEAVARWAGIARERAERLNIRVGEDFEANRDAASRAESGVETEIRGAKGRLEQRPALKRRIEQLEAGIAAERRQIAASMTALPAVRPDAAAPATREEAEALRSSLREEIEALDERGARADLSEHREARNRAANDRTYHERMAGQTRSALRERADRFQIPPDDPLTRESLTAAIPRWSDVEFEQRPDLEAEFETLKGKDGYLKRRRDDLAGDLGLDPNHETLDVEKEKAEYEAVARDHRIRDHAARILHLARERIVGKVLPYTIEHMRRILPALTMDRYHDAKLTDDYKIEVWDERASMWKSKNIFSGGTRDQFSLALRLAFAMATLPQERGAAPGFIFLDEPISSFDVERAEALMYLLTRGEVAETFDQIFVISHTQTMASTDFGYRLRLDAGRIAEASDEMKPSATELFDTEDS